MTGATASMQHLVSPYKASLPCCFGHPNKLFLLTHPPIFLLSQIIRILKIPAFDIQHNTTTTSLHIYLFQRYDHLHIYFVFIRP